MSVTHNTYTVHYFDRDCGFDRTVEGVYGKTVKRLVAGIEAYPGDIVHMVKHGDRVLYERGADGHGRFSRTRVKNPIVMVFWALFLSPFVAMYIFGALNQQPAPTTAPAPQAAPAAPPVTVSSVESYAALRARLGHTIVPVEDDAIISHDLSGGNVNTLVRMVVASDFRCDSISSAVPYLLSAGYTLKCDGYRYVYDIADKGGHWIVTVE